MAHGAIPIDSDQAQLAASFPFSLTPHDIEVRSHTERDTDRQTDTHTHTHIKLDYLLPSHPPQQPMILRYYFGIYCHFSYLVISIDSDQARLAASLY